MSRSGACGVAVLAGGALPRGVAGVLKPCWLAVLLAKEKGQQACAADLVGRDNRI